MKKRTNTATIRLKLESFDPRMDTFRSQLNAELADIQTRLEKMEAVQKGRERKKGKAPVAPPNPDGE